MGREIKRVPIDFDWPLERTWIGYLNPYSGERSFCSACEHTGYNPATKVIADDWYDFARTGRRWCDAITQDEVQALVDAGRLHEFTSHFVAGEGWKKNDPPTIPTAERVNEWSAGPGLGHDAINRMICVKARAKRLGVYGHCGACDGEGKVWTCRAAQQLHEAWQGMAPPTGEGWQVWETVSEGSPVTPVFATADELIDHLANGGDAWDRQRGRAGPSREACERFVLGTGWVPSMVTVGGEIKQGIEAAAVSVVQGEEE